MYRLIRVPSMQYTREDRPEAITKEPKVYDPRIQCKGNRMKKFLLGLLLGISTTAAFAAPWKIPLYVCKLPDKTKLGEISVVKEGMFVLIAYQGVVVTWSELEKAKAVADAIPNEAN